MAYSWRAHEGATGRDHKVPLAGAATALLADLPCDRAKLFSGSNMAMAMLLHRMGRGDLTVHGFRSTFVTWCKDIGVAAELREMALAHAEGEQGGRSLNQRRRGPRSPGRDLAERWVRCDRERAQVVHP